MVGKLVARTSTKSITTLMLQGYDLVTNGQQQDLHGVIKDTQ